MVKTLLFESHAYTVCGNILLHDRILTENSSAVKTISDEFTLCVLTEGKREKKIKRINIWSDIFINYFWFGPLKNKSQGKCIIAFCWL